MISIKHAILVLTLIIPLPLLAQYASDAEKGFNAGQAYESSDFDAVNVSTGNLVVNIPVISYPQRGKVPSFGLRLVYNGKSWQQVQPSNKSLPAKWQFTGNGVQLVYAPAYGAESGSAIIDDTLDYTYHQIVDAYGTIHDDGGVAMDGSGLVAGTIGANYGVRDRDGVFYGEWGAISDPDGNTITPNLSTSGGSQHLTGWTDTLGRVIPAPPGTQYMFWPGENAGVGGNDGINTVCTVTSFPGQSGSTVPMKFCYATYTATSNFQQKYVSEGTGIFTAISSVSLPNGTSWLFSYNSWGDLQSITLPTGGVATYQWQSIAARVGVATSSQERAIQSRTLTPTPGSSTGVMTSTYTFNSDGTVTSTNLAGDYAIHAGNPEFEVKYFDHSLGLLKTVDTTYAPSYVSPYSIVDYNYSRGALPETITTTLPSGQVSETCIIYDNNTNTTCTGTDAYYPNGPTWTDTNPGGTTHPIVYGSELYRYEYDYGQGAPGPLIRATQHVYKWQASGSPYLANNVLSAECLTTVYGPGTAIPVQTSCSAPPLQSNQMAQTINGYDENNGSPQGVLGNLTSVTRWLNTGLSVESQTIYNSQGMPSKKCDPIDTACANPTTYTYDGTGLYPKSIQYPTTGTVQHIEYSTYDENTGELSQQIDQNNQPTGYTYDSMRRLHVVTFPPGGGSESYNYSDTTPTPSFTFEKAINSSHNFNETGNLDGLGRMTQTQITSDPVAPVLQDTTYDSVGRVQSTSNPYRTKTDATYGITAYLYDGLSRKTDQCQADNVASASATCIPTSSYQAWSYNGNVTAFMDEKKNQWQRTSDALGRLTGVLEPSATSASPTLATSYTYDALGNLLSVTQSGLSGTDTPRTRSFTYDSLSRLLCASNPENSKNACPTSPPTSQPWPSGTTLYSYDANGNVISKTDARGITTTYSYDALNRLLSKTYSDGSMSSCYAYDSGAANGIGRLTSEWTQAGSCASSASATKPFSLRTILAYDPMGRVASEQQCTPGAGCTTSSGPQLGYGYDLAGNPTCLINSAGATAGNLTQTPCLSTAVTTPPSGLELLTSYDSAGHMNSVTSNWTALPTPLYTLPTGGYGPVGPVNWTLGPNLSVTQSYTNRLWVNGITATGQLP